MKHLLLVCLLSLSLVGCAANAENEAASRTQVEVRPASVNPSDAADALTPPDGQQQIYVSRTPLLTNADFRSATLSKDNLGHPAISLTLTEDAGERLYAFTRENLNEPLAIFIDGQLAAAPIVRGAIKEKIMITGGRDGFTKDQAQLIVSAINQH